MPFLTPTLSIYLDAVRLLAALAVLVGHLDQDGLHAGWLGIGRFSHEAVVVFFVLSGLVIGHTTPPQRGDWRRYVSARAARILSVVVPAIALSFAVKGAAAVWAGGALQAEYLSQDLRWANLVNAMLFLNESWGRTTALPWNSPYWSLCYEVWYYVLFGLAVFAPPHWRWAWVAAAAVVAGLSIVLMFPLWLFGLGLARQGMRLVPRSAAAGAALFGASVLAFGLLWASGWAESLQKQLFSVVPGYWRLQSSQRFITDHVFGMLVALNFVAVRSLGPVLAPGLLRVAPAVQRAATYTFSLYLFHRPLTEAAGHFYPNVAHDRGLSLAWLLLIVAVCVALGTVTESRKDRWRTWALRCLPTPR